MPITRPRQLAMIIPRSLRVLVAAIGAVTLGTGVAVPPALAAPTVIPIAGGYTTAQDDLITMQLTTTVDARPAGGSSTAPLRIRYTFSPALVAGSGPFGAGDTFASYAPVQKITIEVGDQCVSTGGTGTYILVLDGAGDPPIDSYAVVADATEGAVFSGKLLGKEVGFSRILLEDTQAGMFSDTSLPLSAGFAAASDFQQTVVLLANPPSDLPIRLITPPTGYVLTVVDPVAEIEDTRDRVVAAHLSDGLEAALLAQIAQDWLEDDIPTNDHRTRSMLETFIALVNAQAGEKIPTATAVKLVAQANAAISQLPSSNCP
ncbi:hypothetical protein [Streptosporangium sandarakinum]|uniref:hypothetical protein n=1 Tax=Streptosporangium sandarakinum TaxID=1260955 RepID=UPI00343212EA